MKYQMPAPAELNSIGDSKPLGYTYADMCEAFDAGRKAGLEEAAKIAEVRWKVMKETEEAHYRLSSLNFNPTRFGFEMSACNESRDIAYAIRNLKETV